MAARMKEETLVAKRRNLQVANGNLKQDKARSALELLGKQRN